MLRSRLGNDHDSVARIAAALWARVGRAIEPRDLDWARAVAGEGAPSVLWAALQESHALEGIPPRVNAVGLTRLLALLFGMAQLEPTVPSEPPARLVWTLPTAHVGHGTRGTSYASAIRELIRSSEQSLVLVSPFLDTAGVASLLGPLLDALSRGVRIMILTHDALNVSSFTSRAVEQLRQEAEHARVDLTLYSADAGTGRDRVLYPLLHAKLVVSDEKQLLVGSANLTSYALSTNLETGVLLGAAAATEALAVIDGLIDAACVYLVFRTGVSH